MMTLGMTSGNKLGRVPEPVVFVCCSLGMFNHQQTQQTQTLEKMKKIKLTVNIVTVCHSGISLANACITVLVFVYFHFPPSNWIILLGNYCHFSCYLEATPLVDLIIN